MKVQLKWNQDKMDELSHRLEKILFQRQESGILHNTALWSEGIFEAVCSGDEDRVRELMEQEIRLEGEAGILARDPFRSLRDLVICSVATVTAHIIREGILDSEMAYSISDACIQMVEDTRREEELFEVAGAFCLTLCRHVKKWKSEYHPLVRQTKEYVFKHFHEKIVIEDMAAQLGVSASYLGLIFRKSEGMTLHQFIVREKVERGKIFSATRTTIFIRSASIWGLPARAISGGNSKSIPAIPRRLTAPGKISFTGIICSAAQVEVRKKDKNFVILE